MNFAKGSDNHLVRTDGWIEDGARRPGRSLSAGLLLAAACWALLGAAPAQAQTTVWNATLRVASVGVAAEYGCSNFSFTYSCDNTARLSGDDFTDSSTSYSVEEIVLRHSGRLDFRVSPDIVSGTDRLVLALGNTDPVYLLLSGANSRTGDTRRWNSPGLSWSVGDTVPVKLLDLTNLPPLAPATPTVSAVSGSTTSLSVAWTAPANTGRPAIAGYDVQYPAGSSGGWTSGPQNVTAAPATLTGLQFNTAYQARVRATNAEGDSG